MIIHQRGRGLSPNTMLAQMRAVAHFLDWLYDHDVDFDGRVGSGDLLTNVEIYSLRDHLRARVNRDGVVAGGQFRNRCVSVRDYVAWHAEMVISRIQNADWQRAQAYREALEVFVKLMSSGLPSPAERHREGHSEEIQKTFLEAIHPTLINNPFKRKFRIRNYALLLLYHEHGLRRAEAMKLTGEDLLLHGADPTIEIRSATTIPMTLESSKVG